MSVIEERASTDETCRCELCSVNRCARTRFHRTVPPHGSTATDFSKSIIGTKSNLEYIFLIWNTSYYGTRHLLWDPTSIMGYYGTRHLSWDPNLFSIMGPKSIFYHGPKSIFYHGTESIFYHGTQIYFQTWQHLAGTRPNFSDNGLRAPDSLPALRSFIGTEQRQPCFSKEGHQ